MRHAIIDKNGIVNNIIEWDGVTEWSPPDNHHVMQSDLANRWDTYDLDKKQFTHYHVISGDEHPIKSKYVVNTD